MNKFTKIALATVFAAMFVPVTGALAADTDIYAAGTSSATNPNILILIDNSANWARNDQGWPVGKQGESELTALRAAVSQLGPNVNVGLMMFTKGSPHDGAYIRFRLRPMTDTNRDAFKIQIGASDCPNGSNAVSFTPNCIYKNFSGGANSEAVDKASTDYSAAMFEVFKYFGGYTSPAHAFDDTAGSPVDASHFGALRYAALDPRSDKSAYFSSPDYLSYKDVLGNLNKCAKNYVVLIGNGYPTQDSPASLLTGVGGDATQILAPDFVTVTGDTQTLLATSTAYATQAECEAAALATYGTLYPTPSPLPYPGFKPYVCTSTGTNTSTVTLGTTSCGQYASTADCVTGAAAAFPGYSSYSCAVDASCAGTYSLGTSVCGAYSSVAACQSALPSLYPGYSSFSCALSASTCTPSTVTLNSGTGDFAAGKYATAAACQAAAASKYPGYSSYSCTGTGVSTDLGTTACYASQTACTSAAAALFPGYSAVSCATPAACASARKDVCGGANDYSTTTACNAGAPTALGAAYATYACTGTNSAPANWTGPACSGATGKFWVITGTNNSYAATGTGTAWTVTGTTAAGSRYDMTGTGGNSYLMTGTSTQTGWNIYGVANIMTAVSLGTFTTTSPNYADEWARFLNQTDVSAAEGQQTVQTFAIDVFKDHQDTDQTRLLMSMARAGGGKYFTATNEDGIKKALQKIFAEIQSVNSVFASSSLPVSVNTQGTYLNQVFMGMFRPRGDATPRWAGNLKQYKFGMSQGILRLVDKMGDEAISPTTGFIDPCADSFWSTDTGTYWNYSGSISRGTCRAQVSKYPTLGSTSFWSDAPDGDIVEKGGVAHRLRGIGLAPGNIVTSINFALRNLKTCDGSTPTSCTVFTPFATTNTALTSTVFGIDSAIGVYRNTFIPWVRGKDVDDERDNTMTDEVRPSVHGGVVHSQPAVVDFGGSTGVIAFYGSDDGIFHAIDGGQTDAEGTELWGFIAPEHYKQLHRQRDNGATTPLIDFPGVTGTVAPKDYGFDGGIGVHQQGSTVWIFPSMRRGGRGIYAFNVSTPSSPVIKWRKGCFTTSTSDDSSCTAGWSSIGQTWSKPTVTFIKGYSKPVLVFGGGYDTCEDTNSQTRCTTTPRKGANIWFVDADTGDIIRTYPTNYSVPGDLTILTDPVGAATHVYATDSGGYVYRINVGSYDGTTPPGTASGWSANSAATDIDIASLSEAGDARKFLYGPTVVKYSGFNAVLVGSGDREHPMFNNYACLEGALGGVTNRYYMLLDRPDGYPVTPADNTGLVDVTASSTTTFDTATGIFTNSAGATSTQGWRFDFGPCEQAVNKGLVIAGTAYFGTNTPTGTTEEPCATNLGVARGYAVDFLTGNPVEDSTTRSTVYTGGGMPPSPVAGVVDLGGTKQPFCIGCAEKDCKSSLEGCKVEIHPHGSRVRSYWYIENDD